MENPYDFKHDSTYNLGVYAGFFAAFLFFFTVLYFMLNFLGKLPKSIKYYHILSFVIIVYILGFAILKLRK